MASNTTSPALCKGNPCTKGLNNCPHFQVLAFYFDGNYKAKKNYCIIKEHAKKDVKELVTCRSCPDGTWETKPGHLLCKQECWEWSRMEEIKSKMTEIIKANGVGAKFNPNNLSDDQITKLFQGLGNKINKNFNENDSELHPKMNIRLVSKYCDSLLCVIDNMLARESFREHQDMLQTQKKVIGNIQDRLFYLSVVAGAIAQGK
ncbi:MAG: hypothetical protein FWE50_03330 [Alphaproteobacteria bacterium]|nr:hypothetical protein [Alphaproteobacteria bacterium]